jgi:dTDP-glucose 4,6-dehydratase
MWGKAEKGTDGTLMKILVTGGAGFIGSHFCRYLLANRPSARIVNLDKLTYAANLNNVKEIATDPRYTFIRGDITGAAKVAEAIQSCTAVVHFAAESHVDLSIYDPAPALQTNITGTFTLLEAARAAGIERFLHISTDEVYGDIPPGTSADESAPLQPNSPYAASKAAADLLVRSFTKTYGMPTLIARPSNNYGPNQFPEKFIPLLIANALEGKPIPIYGDGLQQRTWLHVSDTCEALLAILERGELGHTYNVGAADTQDNLSIARRILAVLKLPESLIQHVEDRPGHDRRYALNSEKIRSTLDWSPRTTLADGLAQTISWYRENSGWLEEIRRGDYRTYYEKYYVNRGASLRAIRRGPR